MDDTERRAAGEKIRRAVLGETHVDEAAARTSGLTADFQDLLTRYAWGEIWTRPGLDVRSRRVLVVGTLLALGRWEEFRVHARAAVEQGGLTTGDLKEIVLQQAIYCGIPAANKAFDVLREIPDAGRSRDSDVTPSSTPT
jgi:alkylhydroperoxidase/carboxymuconolactone decarboxylase family protein YurZ